MRKNDAFDITADEAVRHFADFMSNTSCQIDCDFPKYNTYDASVTGATGNVSIVELKGRNIPFDKFSDCEVNLEKLEELQKISRSTKQPAILCAIYPQDDKIVFWTLDNNANYKNIAYWKQTLRHTALEDGEKHCHQVVPLLFSEGKVFDYHFKTDKN